MQKRMTRVYGRYETRPGAPALTLIVSSCLAFQFCDLRVDTKREQMRAPCTMTLSGARLYVRFHGAPYPHDPTTAWTDHTPKTGRSQALVRTQAIVRTSRTRRRRRWTI